jgi:HEAT repeat protein
MPKFPPGVLVKMLRSTNPDVARVAAHDLIVAGKDAVPPLVRALQDGDATLRLHAAQILGEIGAAAQEAVPALEAALPDPSLHSAVDTALRKIRGQEASGAATP